MKALINIKVTPKRWASRRSIRCYSTLNTTYYYFAESYHTIHFPGAQQIPLARLGNYLDAKKFAKKHRFKKVPKLHKVKRKKFSDLVETIRTKKKLLKKHEKEYKKFLKESKMEFIVNHAYNSTNIASHFYSLEQTKQALSGNKRLKNRGKKKYCAVNNYRNAITYLDSIINTNLTEKKFLKLHAFLTKNTLKDKFCGFYRQTPMVLRGMNLMFPLASDVPIFMKNLIDFINKNLNKMDTIELSAIAHYEIMNIHPVEDANGRLARLVANWILMKKGYPPITILKSRFSEYKRALLKASYEWDQNYIIKLWNEYMILEMDSILEKIDPSNKSFDEFMEKNPCMETYKQGTCCEAHRIFHFSQLKSKARQGYKIHVSANKRNAEQVLMIVAPILKKYKVSNKFTDLKYFKSKKNNPRSNLYGKFITIYPKNPKQAAKIAQEIDETLHRNCIRHGRNIKGDKKLKGSKSNLVYYRYGAYYELHIVNSGKEILDDRKKPFPDFIKMDKLEMYLKPVRMESKSPVSAQ